MLIPTVEFFMIIFKIWFWRFMDFASITILKQFKYFDVFFAFNMLKQSKTKESFIIKINFLYLERPKQ